MRKTIFAFALLSILGLVAGCGSSSKPNPMPASLDWRYYGNDAGGMRYADVDQIKAANAAQLKPAWILHTNVFNAHTSFEAQPIIVGGTLYVSSPHDHVFALDAATGEIRWTYNPTLPPLSELAICCGQTNRGVAFGNGKVFIGQLDAKLVALDAGTGKVAWQTQVADPAESWTVTMAPQYLDGKVFVGASGGEFLNRGFVDAYDANTGKLVWRFYTVPAPGEPGNETWSGDSWKTGGATVWSTPQADPSLGLLYVTTGNAAPDENGSQRAGDNLNATSIVALDVNTGKPRWHFQEVHHDLWDYDAVQPVHLFMLRRDGQDIPALGHANKNGNYFVLDRRDGKPLYAVTEVAVPTEPSWQHPSPTQPMPATDPLIPHQVEQTPPGLKSAPLWTPPQEQPLLIQPGYEAGPEWTAAAYSPRTRYAYIPAGGYEPWLYHAMPSIVNSVGSTMFDQIPGVANYGLFDALDTTTGKIAWQIRADQKIVSCASVAGDLVFFGESSGKFNAVDAKTGTVVWSYASTEKDVGGANGCPAVYVVKGREYVVMPFGGNNQVRSNLTPGASPTGDALIAFALPGSTAAATNVVRAQPRQVETGAIPDSAMIDRVPQAPPGATVIEMTTSEFTFSPKQFSVQAGRQIAVHIVNTGVPPSGIAIKLPSGPIALKGPVKPKEDAYFVFVAPDQPGDYQFFSPIGAQRFFGMTGTMTVKP